MRLNDLVIARPILEKIAGMEMDAKLAMEFAEYLRMVLAPIQAFELKRAELFQTFGSPVENEEEERPGLQILPENEEAFNTAITEALEAEVTVPVFDITSLGIKMTPADLVNVVELFK